MQRSGIELLFQGQNLVRLLGGLWVSASIALIAMALSIVLGIGLGIVMAFPELSTWLPAQVFRNGG